MIIYRSLFLSAFFFSTLSLASAAPEFHPGNVVPSIHWLSKDESDALREILRTEDAPQRLAQVLGGKGDHFQLVPDALLNSVLRDAVRLDRIESFRLLFPLACRDGFDLWRRSFLRHAADLHRLEIADYLLGQGFWAESLFVDFSRLPRQVSLDTFLPDVTQLRELAGRHPEKMVEIAPLPGWFRHIDDAQIILFLIDFIEHCRSISPDFADHPIFKPNNMLLRVLSNGLLEDAGMASVITRLVGMGATIEEERREAFRQSAPEHGLALDALSAAVPFEEDIKEPECY